MEKDEKNKLPQTSVETSVIDFESDDDVLRIITSNKRCTSEWVLDSGFTYYMYPHRDWFSIYEPLE